MNKLDPYYLKAENFLCFGKQPVELDLRKYGNIILVRGIDMDRQMNDEADEEEQRKASNGVGKSAVGKILVYTLFGKTIKEKLSNEEVINNKTGSKLRTEVRWGDYRVVRQRKPNKLQIWESKDHVWSDSTEISKGGIPETQKLIIDKLGLSYQTFVNTVIFTDNHVGSFLECDTETKREIVENLLSLSDYRQFHERAKKKRNGFKDHIADMAKNYERLLIELETYKSRITKIGEQEATWKKNKQTELSLLVASIKQKKQHLETTDTGAALSKYNEAQDQITALSDSIPALHAKLAKIEKLNKEAKDKADTIRLAKTKAANEVENFKAEANALSDEITNTELYLKQMEGQIGTDCPTCLAPVKEDNFATVIEKEKQRIQTKTPLLLDAVDNLKVSEKRLATETTNLKTIENTLELVSQKSRETSASISAAQKKISDLSKINKPVAGTDEKVLEGQIEELKKQAFAKKNELDGESPYVEILKSAKEEAEEKLKEVQKRKADLVVAEKDLPYYEFWVKAFGDSGIRKFIIDGIIPALNSRIAHWLQFLIDGKIKLQFDNELNELIERNPADGDPFVYYAMSGGERRRLNLAVSQAFAYVMMINSGASPSLVFLDEVTTNIDPVGVEGVYKMIVELARTKQVFVTTHDRDLLEILSGCETINLVKKDGFTTLN